MRQFRYRRDIGADESTDACRRAVRPDRPTYPARSSGLSRHGQPSGRRRIGARRRRRRPGRDVDQREGRAGLGGDRAAAGQRDRREVRDHPVVGRVVGRGAVHGQVPVEGVALRRDAVRGADHPDQLVQVGAVLGAGRGDDVLLEHDRAEVVDAHVQGELADVLAGGQPGRLQVRDVVEEEPGHRDEPQVLQRGRLGAALEVVVLRLVGPRDEGPEAADPGGLDRRVDVTVGDRRVLHVADHPDVLDPLGVGLAGAHHHGRGGARGRCGARPP